MLANDPVLNDKLTEKGGGVGLTAVIPPDMRAMSVRVDAVIGVAGFVLPGTYVDVIVTGQPRQNDDPTAKVILENVKVLTADKNLDSKDKEGKAIESKVVTLLVKPDQAEKLALASSDKIYLALRNPLADPKGEHPVNPPYIKKPELYYGTTPIFIEKPKSGPGGGRLQPRPPVSRTVEIEVRLGSKTEKTTVDREQPSLTRPMDGKM
jgi:Flp pilus assembly protein CpaB